MIPLSVRVPVLEVDVPVGLLDGVGVEKLQLSIASLFTCVQTVLEVVNRSCRHNVIRKSIPMFDCPLAKEV